jgi:diguanylate cyclase (GGDEF)-like protein/PAS domain S-box-containing protein
MPAARPIHCLNNFPNPAFGGAGTTIRTKQGCTMLHVYACLTEQHDLRLVFLAGLICIAACLISMNLFVHANGAERGRPLSWLLGAATVFGAGVWAFHFISLLAYEPGFPVGYDAASTAISLVGAIGAVWLAMFVAYRFAAPMLGGAMIGAGIAVMHYEGMAALRAPAHLHWDTGYVLASVAIAMTFAAAAMRASSWGPVMQRRLMAVVLLVLAIAGLHFTAMAAVTLVPDPLIAVPVHAVTPTVLAILIATVTALIAGLGLLDLIVDDHLALRAAREAERLRRSADHLARAQRIAHTGSIEQDLRTGGIEWFGDTYRIFGLDPNLPAPAGEAFLALFHPDDRAACETQGPAHQAAAAGQLHGKPHASFRFRIVQPGGAVRWVRHDSELVLDERGAAVRWIGTYKDVTEVVEAEESFRLLFEGNPVPMWLFDLETLKFMAVNDTATAHYGYDRGSFLKMTLLDMVPQEDRHDVKNAIRNNPIVGGNPSHIWQHVKADGKEIDVLTFCRDTMFCDRPAQLVAIVDVTAKRQAEARIAHMAHHDALTGLPNRVLFLERLDETLLRVRRYPEILAVLYLDLDQFKNVNDTLGHPAGDRLLQAVADRLRTCLRDCDMVARFGGDEFAVLQIGLAAPHEAGALGERIVTLLSEPYDIDGLQAVIGASVGIALAPADGETAEQLLRNADIALYQAKEDGRRTFRFFEPGMGVSLRNHRTLERDLRNALGAGEFEVYYQPLVTLETGVICGFEALLRWHHPVRGMVAPAEFVPLAEEIGLIVPIGEWVLRQACAEAATWPDDLKVAVNLSPVQFKKSNLPQLVFATLASTGLPAARLELEITESLFLTESKTNLATLRSLRALGVGIAMDDFGIGYSGLSYLRAFPFDKIKIDRSFISELGESADCMAIIKAVTKLGSTLGIPTLAEGAETEKQLALLREAGCTEMQGYLFSRPVPASEIAGLLSSRRNCRQTDEYLLTA